MTPIVTGILLLASFLLTLSILEKVCKKSSLPLVCWILIIGVIYGLVNRYTGFNLPIVKIESDVIIYLFLPLLIFDSSRRLDLISLRKVGLEVTFLSTLGVLITATIIAVFFKFFTQSEWIDAFLIGAILSPTDPVAISAIFGNFKMPEKLKMIVEGESLVNDGTAIILFSIVYAARFSGTQTGAIKVFEMFSISIFAAIFIGIILAYICVNLFDWVGGLKTNFAATLLPLVFCYLGFIVMQNFFEVSGVITVMSMTITMAIFWQKKSKKDELDLNAVHATSKIWDFLAEITNGLLFVCVGAEIGHFFTVKRIWITLSVIGLLFFSRAAIVYIKPLVFALVGKKGAPISWGNVLLLAGLRGGLCIALILTLPSDYQYLQVFLIMAFVMILFSNIINPLVMLKYLHKCDFSHDE